MQRIAIALETLLQCYQQDYNQMDGKSPCCLCETMGAIAAEQGISRCERCPWIVMTDMVCSANFKMFVGKPYDRFDQHWIQMRLEQLPVWIAAYRNIYPVVDTYPHVNS